MPSNRELSDHFEHIARVLELTGANRFRVLAYQRASRVIKDMTADINSLAATPEKLTAIDGIGKGIAALITEFVTHGKIKEHDNLIATVPPGVLKMMQIPGVGPKTAATLWHEADITTLDQLKQKLHTGELKNLPRMGEKTLANIAQSLSFVESASHRVRLGQAQPTAAWFVSQLRQLPGVEQADFAGSLRRGRDTIGDLDLLVAVQPDKLPAVADAFKKLEPVTSVIADGETKISVRLESNMQVDLRLITPDQYGAALAYFTGSKEHNVALRQRAIKMKLRLNEYGLWRSGSHNDNETSENKLVEVISEFSAPGTAVSSFGGNKRKLWIEQLNSRASRCPGNTNEKGINIELTLACIDSGDLDNLCDAPLSVIVRDQQWFAGNGQNIQWLHAIKKTGNAPECRVAISRSEYPPRVYLGKSVLVDSVYAGEYPQDSEDSHLIQWASQHIPETPIQTCGMYLGFGKPDVNLRDISTGYVKHFIDSIKPIYGVTATGKPDDAKICELVVEKGVSNLGDDQVKIVVWNINQDFQTGVPQAMLTHQSDDKPIASKTEAEIYDQLKLPWIPPELREDRGEIAAAESGKLPNLVTLADIHCELHAHTRASDGKLTIEELAAVAKERGFHTLAITDHSVSQAQAHGLSAHRLEEHITAIHEARKHIKGITLLAGSEVDILADGKLDYPNSLLKQLDIVVASPHVALSQDPRKATARLLKAIEHPYVNIIGHPTGRLIGKREGLAPDMAALIKAAADTGTALEINANPWRLDLRDTHAKAAIEAGVLLAIDTDAHSSNDFDNLRYGLLTARRAWAEPRHIVNCMTNAKLKTWLGQKRKKMG